MLSVGLIGAGHWGPKIARCLDQLGALAAIVELDTDRLSALGERYPAAARFATLDSALTGGLGGAGAVAIATPIRTHAALVERALFAGLHVFVEKPLCTDPRQAAALVQLADDYGCVLHVGHTYTYHPALVMLRQMIGSGDLGTIRYATAEWSNNGIVQYDLSVLWSVGPHPLSILAWLFGGPAETVRATGAAYLGAVEDVVQLAARWPGGQCATVHLSWLAPVKTRRLTIVGTAGSAVFDEQAADTLRLYDDRARLVRVASPIGEPLLVELATFCRRDPRVPNDGQAGVDVVRMLVSAERSIKHGGVIQLLARRVSSNGAEAFAREAEMVQ